MNAVPININNNEGKGYDKEETGQVTSASHW